MRHALLVLSLVACEAQTEVAPEEDAPPVEISAGVDRAVATTGDVITYTLEVEHDPGIELKMPDLGSEIAGFRIVDLGEELAPLSSGRVVETWWYELRADLVGSYVLPSAEVAWRMTAAPEDGDAEAAASDWTTEETSQIFIEVASVLPDGEELPEDIRDIKPLRPAPPAVSNAWAWGLGGLLLLAGLGYALWRWQQRVRQPPPPRPAHEVAYEALDALRDVDVSDLEAVRRWYFALSEVLRTYVEGRFGLNATDLTSEEILDRLTELTELTEDDRGRLRAFLRDTDQVKYAARPPSEDDVAQSYEQALSFVESTAKRPEDEVEDGAPAGEEVVDG